MLSSAPIIRKRLLGWYRRHARDLPWRRTRDPYAIWVSEIMLQQTQVQTVIPYYERWLKRFPTLESLAAASLDEVLPFWAGLGYYRRAKMLHAAARFVRDECKGRIPQEPEELMKVPGIGRYTAGAISSIAFEKPVPLVDGNVIRILTRLFAVKKDISRPETLRQIWEISAALVPQKHPGDFNQAMMELGATLCLPRTPSCLVCPVSGACRAFALGTPEKFPVKVLREKIQKIENAALILKNPANEVLIGQQPAQARWGGLWMFPFGGSLEEITARFQLKKIPEKACLQIRHGFTKHSIDLRVFEASVPARAARTLAGQGLRWARIPELTRFAFPSPHKKIVSYLAEAC